MEKHPDVRALCNTLLGTRSLTVMEMYIETALRVLPDLSAEDRVLLNKMYESRDLDFVWSEAHEYLGNKEQASSIRAFMLKKEQKKWSAS